MRDGRENGQRRQIDVGGGEQGGGTITHMEFSAQEDCHPTNSNIGEIEQRQQGQPNCPAKAVGNGIGIRKPGQVGQCINHGCQKPSQGHPFQECSCQPESLHWPGRQISAEKQCPPNARAQPNDHRSTVDQQRRNKSRGQVGSREVEHPRGVPNHQPGNHREQQRNQETQEDKDSEATDAHTRAQDLCRSARHREHEQHCGSQGQESQVRTGHVERTQVQDHPQRADSSGSAAKSSADTNDHCAGHNDAHRDSVVDQQWNAEALHMWLPQCPACSPRALRGGLFRGNPCGCGSHLALFAVGLIHEPLLRRSRLSSARLRRPRASSFRN